MNRKIPSKLSNLEFEETWFFLAKPRLSHASSSRYAMIAMLKSIARGASCVVMMEPSKERLSLKWEMR